MKYLLIACLMALIFSCELNSGVDSNDDEFVQMMFDQVGKDYESLPELLILKKGEVSTFTNFTEVDSKIMYKGEIVVRNVLPLYGSGDVLVIEDQKQLVFLYKNSLNHSIMKYDYTLIGMRVKDNIVIIKGYRVDHVIYIKSILSTDKPVSEYVYKY